MWTDSVTGGRGAQVGAEVRAGAGVTQVHVAGAISAWSKTEYIEI